MEESKMLDNLRRLCSKREYCSADIASKIRKAEFSEDAAQRMMSMLREEKFLSDLRYATAFARDKASLSGWGVIKIRYALSAKGIARADIDAAISEIDASCAEDKMEKVLSAKYKLLREDPQCYLKLLRFALGRGYTYDDAAPVVERLVKRGE